MNKKDYYMTTVCKYIEMLDKDSETEKKKTDLAAKKYLLSAKNKANVEMLEDLLA